MDTYAPMVRTTTIRVLFVLTANHKMVLFQIGVKIIFINEYLEEEIHMKQSKSYIVLGQENKVCKLRKSLYKHHKTGMKILIKY